MKRVIWYLIAVMVLASLLIVGCALPSASSSPATGQSKTSAPASNASQTQTIKVGIIYPLTGLMAMTGERMVTAVKFAFDEVGYKIGGKTIEVVVEDATDSPDGAMDKTKKLVQSDKVCMVIGPLTSVTKMAIAPFLSQQKIPHITSAPISLKIADYPWSFSAGGSNYQHPSAMATYAFKKLGIKSVTGITSDDVDGHDFFTGFKNTFTKLGGQVIQEQYAPRGTTDFAPYFSAFKKADAVAGWFSGADGAQYLIQYHQFGVDKNMPLVAIFMGSFFQPIILNRLPPDVADSLVGEYTPTQWSSYLDDAASKKFVESYKSKHNIVPEEVESSAYLGGEVAVKALQATNGDTNPDALYKALLALDFISPEGRISFDQQTRLAVRTVYIAKIDKKDGKYVTVPVETYKDILPSGL